MALSSSSIRPIRHLCALLPTASAAIISPSLYQNSHQTSSSSSSPFSSSSSHASPSSSSWSWWPRSNTLHHDRREENRSSSKNNNAGVTISSSPVFSSSSIRRGYSAFASGYSALTRKTLDSIMKLESVKDASPEDLTTIWNEYHIGRGHVSAVMGSPLFEKLQQRASSCPLFVIPVRRGQGYVTLLMQAQMPYLLFTGLNDYRARGSDATPYLTVTHYTEFSETKGLVLVRGDVVLTGKLSDKEAIAALEAAHSFYLTDSRYKLLTTFNKDSQDFEFRDVLRELNMSA
ncbi:unnamed protein product [Calypogeia fissa]